MPQYRQTDALLVGIVGLPNILGVTYNMTNEEIKKIKKTDSASVRILFFKKKKTQMAFARKKKECHITVNNVINNYALLGKISVQRYQDIQKKIAAYLGVKVEEIQSNGDDLPGSNAA